LSALLPLPVISLAMLSTRCGARKASPPLFNSMRDGDWKWLKDEKGEYLFNVAKDPGEKNNLKEKETAIFDRLKKKYEQWETTVLKPVPLGG